MEPCSELGNPYIEIKQFEQVLSGVPFFLPFSPQNPGSEAFLLFAAESCKMVQIE